MEIGNIGNTSTLATFDIPPEGGVMEMTRREFVKGGLASLGFLALPGTPMFAAPAGWKPKKKPNLVFGVVSDTHMRCHYDGKSFYEHYDVRFDDQALVMVMKLFKKTGVDAILHCGDAPFPHVMCSTLAYWKAHNGEGDHPHFAKGFGNGTATGNMDSQKADHALLVRVYDDMMTISRIWVSVKPKPAIGSLGPDWVMPLNWGTYPPSEMHLRRSRQVARGRRPSPEGGASGCASPRSGCPSRGGNGERGMNDHPLREENYVKVIGSPEFPKGAKLEVSLKGTVLRIKIPKADGNPDSRVYGYNVVVAGGDGTKLKKSVYARGYCMGIGYEPEGGVTTLEIPKSELPAGKKLAIGVRPCSSLATRGKPITTTLRS